MLIRAALIPVHGEPLVHLQPSDDTEGKQEEDALETVLECRQHKTDEAWRTVIA